MLKKAYTSYDMKSTVLVICTDSSLAVADKDETARECNQPKPWWKVKQLSTEFTQLLLHSTHTLIAIEWRIRDSENFLFLFSLYTELHICLKCNHVNFKILNSFLYNGNEFGHSKLTKNLNICVLTSFVQVRFVYQQLGKKRLRSSVTWSKG